MKNSIFFFWLILILIKIILDTKGYFARKRYLLKRDSAITIQSFAKKCFTRKNFLSLKKASIQFQTAIRSFQERKTFLLKKNLAFLVQISKRKISKLYPF